MADVVSNLASGLEAAIQSAVQTALANNANNVNQNTQNATNNVNQSTQNTTNNVSQTTPPTTGQAVPTNVSQFNAPLVKEGNMQTGEYTTPYQAEQQGLVQQLGAAKTYETSPETQNFLKGLFKSQTEKFDYVAENDPLVQKAKANVTQVVTNMAAKRGFAFGSQTQDMISQQMAKVLPQFENIARGEHEDFLNRQLNLANTIMTWEQIQFDRSQDQIKLLTTKMDFINKLSDRDFDQFKLALDQRNIERNMYLEQQRFDLQKRMSEQSMALTRLENLGYVDQEGSVILGVPIGTQAKWVKQMAMEQANKLELMAKQLEYDLAKQQLDMQIEKELYALKSRLDYESQLKMQAITYQYKKDLQALDLKKDQTLVSMEFSKDQQLATMDYANKVSLVNIEYQKDLQLLEIEYQKDLKLKQIEEAKKAAEEAARAAKARSSGGGGSRSGGGGGSSSKTTSAYGKTNTQLNSEFSTAKAKIQKFVNNGASSADLNNNLDIMYRNGTSPEVIVALRDWFSIPTQTYSQDRTPGSRQVPGGRSG
jgi:hypothetical protein